MIQKTLLLLVCTAFFAVGCSDDTAVVESTFSNSAILLNDMQLSSYVVDTDTVDVVQGQTKSANDPVNIRLQLQVSTTNPDRVGSLRFEIRLDGKTNVLYAGDLLPSATPEIWTANIVFERKRGDVGDYRVDVIGTDDAGISANSAHAKFRILFGSRPPVIIAVTAPDTVDLQLQTLIIFITAEVSDESGLADIRQVTFNLFLPSGKPSASNPQILRDDASPLSGDVTAGDGIYSITVQMPPDTPKGEYRFEFRALDYSNLTSNVVIHKLIVR
ncbi:MAG: choice-of-anchor X domain-containing protein [Bacteroidota bacterium]|jgi:hypothetical protein